MIKTTPYLPMKILINIYNRSKNSKILINPRKNKKPKICQKNLKYLNQHLEKL